MKCDRRGAASKVKLSWRFLSAPAVVLLCSVPPAHPQGSESSVLQEQVRRLSDQVSQVQATIDQSQRELAELRNQLAALQRSAGLGMATAEGQTASLDASGLAAAVATVRENQSVHDSQLATLEQTKVESESKYPLKVSGLILMTGLVNTQGVDIAETPTIAVHGAGSTAATIRQTILGIDARGPHLFGATSHADARFDFYGNAGGSGYTTGTNLGLLRMRTAHAELDWQHSNAFFSLDRPLMSPDTPTSLTAVAVPALAWSGTLWTWNPQVGASHDFLPDRALNLRIQAALIDVADPPQLYPTAATGGYIPASTAAASRWPGIQGRVAIVNAGNENGAHVGFGGYFAPHLLPQSDRFNSWAATIDFNLPATRYTQLTGSAYTGQALGGLGAGAFKDYLGKTYHGEWYFRALDDMGGWVQWKQRLGEKVESNEAFGMDNVPAHQIRRYSISNDDSYYNLARNRTVTGNVIYSPSAYLLFSLEYRRIASSYVNSPTEFSDVIGLGAGYKF
jgi:hypothetical protein